LNLSPSSHTVSGSQQIGVNSGQGHLLKDSEEDPLTSSDDECPVLPPPGWRHEWLRFPNGEKYFTEVRIPDKLSGMEYKWVKDAVTGRTTKQLVRVEQESQEMDLRMVIDPTTGKEVQMLVPRTPTQHKLNNRRQKISDVSTHVNHRVQSERLTGLPIVTAPLTQHERVPSYISPTDDKQGKDIKVPVIVQYARNCPVAWTSKVTSDKLNMCLWCWAFVSELLATRTGHAPTLGPGELEARMQHFLNVLEIALQPSNPTEYDGQSWKVARLYAEKIQQKVDRGRSSWVAFLKSVWGRLSPT
jgi:hypothetical protein